MRVMLYFGSFNPVHKAHIAVAEYVVEQGLTDEVVLVVSPQNPFKEANDLAPEMERFEGVERAVEASRYPTKIKASAVEFLLPRPSYTIDTLRFLETECPSFEFSILVGEDILADLDKWKDIGAIVAKYPIFVYPRATTVVEVAGYAKEANAGANFSGPQPPLGGPLTGFEKARNLESASRPDHPEPSPGAGVTILTGAPRMNISSTEIRALLSSGRERYRNGDFGAAANDFARALELAPTNAEATGYQQLIDDIQNYQNTDLLNP